jgi:hypothetical protein
MRTVQKFASAALAVGLTVVLAGCGTPGAPQPPSLNLPIRVSDLAAVRSGNQVSLTWTMPRKNTDKLLLKNNITAHICRRESHRECIATGSGLPLAPGAAGVFTETLPAALTEGAPHTLSYFVEVRNRNGRSAGQSNAAVVLAGQAPAPVTSLTAEARKEGVVLRWTPLTATAPESARTVIRLHRKLLTAESNAKPSNAERANAEHKDQQGLLTPPPEPVERSLLVEPGTEAGIDTGPAAGAGGTPLPDRTRVPDRAPHRAPDRALDRDIRLGQRYEYRAQRVAQVTVDGQTLELAGELSPPVEVEVKDIFPPAVPTGLAAVATAAQPAAASTAESAANAAAEAATQPSIDLSWQPVTDTGLAGYIVYRREAEGAWQRISPAQPQVAPAFHDVQVLPGHTYRYRVSSIGQSGHESAPSVETEETVPAP